MVKQTPFHSTKSTIEPNHHDDKARPEGRKIEVQWLAAGTARRPRGEHCAKLQARGNELAPTRPRDVASGVLHRELASLTRSEACGKLPGPHSQEIPPA